MIILGSYFFRPDQQLSVFSQESHLLPFTDQKTIEFLIIIAEFLSNGLSFDNSLNKALSIYLENFNLSKTISPFDRFKIAFMLKSKQSFDNISRGRRKLGTLKISKYSLEDEFTEYSDKIYKKNSKIE